MKGEFLIKRIKDRWCCAKYEQKLNKFQNVTLFNNKYKKIQMDLNKNKFIKMQAMDFVNESFLRKSDEWSSIHLNMRSIKWRVLKCQVLSEVFHRNQIWCYKNLKTSLPQLSF